MSISSPAAWLATFIAFSAFSARAQPGPAGPPAPGAVLSLPYESALAGYRSFKDEALLPWREANALVQQRGGWRAYAKESGGDSAADGKAVSAPLGHAGHAMPMAMPAKDQP